MNSPPMFVAALVMFPAIGAKLWAWCAMQRAENPLRVDARLEKADFDIGTWPSSNPAGVA